MVEFSGVDRVARRGSRRANLQVGVRSRQVKLRLSEDEFALLSGLARAAGGVSVQAFLMRCALAGSREEAAGLARMREELAGVRYVLGTVANNVNQVARHVNLVASGVQERVLVEDVEVTLAGVRSVVERLDRVLGDS